ncbi:hypothetical protein [Bradymonas sediminis]|uniref:Uncharacterized protein n=1 Tax=Bradymonas sediminis TaxID=1548548 RepID=A0A2Z4FND8_9DELT|nr:hypothetical protein [Bradymonas sediminis]AWV90295.1 hypothetical protein DN745_13530 [Bradymonas sediminis]TDP75734.1 hypothetical protein DFR33_10373 [Bradymonas sediminis]
MASATLRIAALSLVTLLAAGIASAPRAADACDPMPEGLYLQPTQTEQLVPVDGAWAVRIDAISFRVQFLRNIEVRDESDQVVNGSLAYELMSESPYIPNQTYSEHLVIWTPDEPLLPDHTYSARLLAEFPDEGGEVLLDEQRTFRTAGEQTTTLEVATMGDFPAITTHESQGSTECCRDLSNCDSCGRCETCWPTQTVYQSQLELTVSLPTGDADLQTYHRLEASNGYSQLFWDRRDTHSFHLLFPKADSGPNHCVTLKTYALASQELIEEVENCFDHSVPDAVDLEGVERPDSCTASDDVVEHPYPDAVGIQDTSGEPDASGPEGPDAVNPELGADVAGGGCGCSATPNAPTSLLGMMFFFITLGALRLPIFSRRR